MEVTPSLHELQRTFSMESSQIYAQNGHACRSPCLKLCVNWSCEEGHRWTSTGPWEP